MTDSIELQHQEVIIIANGIIAPSQEETRDFCHEEAEANVFL